MDWRGKLASTRDHQSPHDGIFHGGHTGGFTLSVVSLQEAGKDVIPSSVVWSLSGLPLWHSLLISKTKLFTLPMPFGSVQAAVNAGVEEGNCPH